MNKFGLYILAYDKEVDLSENDMNVLYCGKTDNTGDNISNKNPYFVETTGIYWIWKNSDADIKGQMQFRRFLSINPNFISIILNDYDIITASPCKLDIPVQFHYEIYHNIDDILDIKEILSKYYKEYLPSYDRYIKDGNILYYSNSFICTKKIYDDLCSFCFSVLEIFENKNKYYDDKILTEHCKETLNKWIEEKRKNYSHNDVDMINYQKRIFGYLFERLVILYIFHNGLKVYDCGEYIKMEENMKI